MITLEGVSKIYKMGSEELKGADEISLHVDPGDFVALRGPSGSGKSTVMNILGCLDKPDSGRYLLKERDVSRLKDRELAKIRNQMIGFVHQSFNLLPRLDALENVELPLIYAGIPKKERLKRAEECLKAVGLEDRMRHLPIQLSGGQQQRVAIARALVNRASLILADEPTGNLDSRSSVEIMTILQHLNEEGATIVLVTHEPDVAEWARTSIYFKDGRIAG